MSIQEMRQEWWMIAAQNDGRRTNYGYAPAGDRAGFRREKRKEAVSSFAQYAQEQTAKNRIVAVGCLRVANPGKWHREYELRNYGDRAVKLFALRPLRVGVK
jgi:hypothetical protein